MAADDGNPYELRFDGRVAIVTGSGSGLGRSHALLLASRGAQVVVNDLAQSPDTTATVVSEIEAAGGVAVGHTGDIATENGANGLVEAALQQFGRIDILVNNAGMLRTCDFGEMTAELFDEVVAVNLRSTFLVCRAVWAPMAAASYGRIVSTTSNSGLLGTAGSTAYAAAKAGIWGLTRSLALEGSALGINVNAIAPIAYTAMSANSRIAPRKWRTGEGDAWSKQLEVAQVSPAVAWLAHEDCTIYGHILSVAGGRVARFNIGLSEGFVSESLTIEQVRDHEHEWLAEMPTTFFATAADEGRSLHSRLMTGPD